MPEVFDNDLWRYLNEDEEEETDGYLSDNWHDKADDGYESKRDEE